MAYNEYQRMHYQAMFGTPDNKPKQTKKYGLYAGNQLMLEGEYSLLVWKKKQLSQSHTHLKIKPIKSR
jgi:hypothetical protein